MNPLPFAISIPHGGWDVPPEFAPLVVATAADQREDIDHLTREIFAQPEHTVAHQVVFDIARTFVDLNRRPGDFGPGYTDGVVKSLTHIDAPIFSEFPSDEVVQAVLDQHFHPYHAGLAKAVADPEVVLLLDCHSMAPYGLSVSPDQPGKPRPLINLGHRGGATAPLWLVECLQEIMAEVYDLPKSEISIDHPFNGGYITSTHGVGRVYAIQIEFHRAFYLGGEEGKVSPYLQPEVCQMWSERFGRVLALLQERAFDSSQELATLGTGLPTPVANN